MTIESYVIVRIQNIDPDGGILARRMRQWRSMRAFNIVDHEYILGELIGAGGMARVYTAEDVSMVTERRPRSPLRTGADDESVRRPRADPGRLASMHGDSQAGSVLAVSRRSGSRA